ncbi:MAG: hypothetical protein A4E66_00160 [Syntrophus sp. PtaB.Bin001]|nr:MAG: hypothetical protein A4E66_00160 [Syntrophus sp. PtaB.Bin001]
MDILTIISIGGLILKAITVVEDLFSGTDNAGADKKELVMTIAQKALLKAVPNADPKKLTEASATIDEFIEAGVKMMKAVSK